MSEAMTVETIVEAYWQMQGGYWTRLRYPFQTKKSGWSDIDILAYNPEKKILVIAESKVRGPKRDVYVYTKDSKKKYGDIFDFDYGVGYLSFLSHLKTVCSDGLLFSNFEKMVDKVVIQLVSNYQIERNMLPKVKNDVTKKIHNSFSKRIKYDIRVDTTFDIICEIIKLENESEQGRRYGHPVIDIARELNRYLHPSVKCAGTDKTAIADIKKALKSKIEETLKL